MKVILYAPDDGKWVKQRVEIIDSIEVASGIYKEVAVKKNGDLVIVAKGYSNKCWYESIWSRA